MSKESNNYNDFSYQYEFVYKDIDEEMNVYETVKKTMQTLKGSQFDLIEEMQSFMMGELSKSISEMSKTAFPCE